jgi:hypothetical protein
MSNLTDVVLTVAVIGGILVVSAIFTSLFTRAMYYRCPACRSLNAKRRVHCRICGAKLDGE